MNNANKEEIFRIESNPLKCADCGGNRNVVFNRTAANRLNRKPLVLF